MIRHSAPTVGEEESEAVARTVRSGQLAQGLEVEGFERETAEFVGRKYAVALSSGTAALHMGLAALGADQKSIIAIPSYACASLVTASHLVGARASLVDITADFSIDINLSDLFGFEGPNTLWLGYYIHHRSAIFESASHYGRIKGGSNYNAIYLLWHF